jgi:hypothetical protein
MTIFGLVHGAGLGAWCWERLIRELESRGHQAVTVDLPLNDQSAGANRLAEMCSQPLPGLMTWSWSDTPSPD